LLVVEREDRETASGVESVFEDEYVDQVDRALESFAPVRRFGVREFGEMVARRGVKRHAR
jgi:hypothetical protein